MRIVMAENNRLLNLIITNNSILKPNVSKPAKIITVVNTKEIIKREIVRNTVYIHDTVTVVSYQNMPANEQIAFENTTKEIGIDSVPVSTIIPIKKNKLHFVIAHESNVVADGAKFRIGTSKSFYSKDQEVEQKDVLIKFALN